MIFGSTAAKHWFSDFRDPKDLDLIGKSGEITKEIQIYWAPTFEKIIELNKDSKYIDPEFLLTIKASHAGWNIHWEKQCLIFCFSRKRG